MRQWELIGITDQVVLPPPTRRLTGTHTVRGVAPERPVFFWNTDSALRLTTHPDSSVMPPANASPESKPVPGAGAGRVDSASRGREDPLGDR